MKKKKKNGSDQLRPVSIWLRLNRLRLVVEPTETSTDQSFMVPIAVVEFLSFGKPVVVVVLTKKGKKPDWTGLLNTNNACRAPHLFSFLCHNNTKGWAQDVLPRASGFFSTMVKDGAQDDAS